MPPHLDSPTASGPLLQHRLEAALLRLGRFQSQLDWLLQWLLSTEEQLRNPLPLMPDLQSCEIELAKHQVVWGPRSLAGGCSLVGSWQG